MFDELHDQLMAEWGSSSELLILLGNFNAAGAEIDAAVIKASSFTVIDFKNYGGKIEFSENGEWKADGTVVGGGTFKNPYLQLQRNRRNFRDALKAIPGLNGLKNPDHGSAMVVFHELISFDQRVLPPQISSWFRVCDLDHVVRALSEIASPSIRLSDGEIIAIPRALGLVEYSPAGSGILAEQPAPRPTSVSISGPLIAPYRQVVQFFEIAHQRILVVRGMVGTGKRGTSSATVLAVQEMNEKKGQLGWKAVRVLSCSRS